MSPESRAYTLCFLSATALLFFVGAFAASPTNIQEQESEAVQEKETRSDRPDDAARFRRLQMKDEKGFIPADGLERARQHVKSMRVAPKSAPSPTTGVKPDSWEPLGPGNIGGRIRSIVIHPTVTNTMWVGSVGGGIWRTDDGGGSWYPLNDFMANLAVSTMVLSPTAPSTIYAGTGEIFAGSFNTPGAGFTPDGLLGAGVFRTQNGGLTWEQLSRTNPANPGNPPLIPPVCPNPATPANCPWLYVNRLAIASDGVTILAATGLGIQRSPDAGTTWAGAGGAGGTWLDIDFHPTNSLLAIASGNSAAAYSANGGQNWTAASFSTDGGVTFNAPISGRVEVAYARSNPLWVYASVDQNNGEIFRSTDGGVTYIQRNTGTNFFLQPGPPPSSQGNYDNIIWVNPQDPTFIVVGGIDLWRSTNSGTTFTQISSWQNAPGSSAHADHHMIVAHPGFNNTSNRNVYFANDGGIYQAGDVATVAQTSGWTQRNNNLGITQFYGAAGNFIDDVFGNPSPIIYGGTQDNGTLAYFGSTSWGIGRGGDGGFCAADPEELTYYGEYVNLTIYRSMFGSPFADIYAGITDANNGNSAANFIAPFILDPNNSNTMLAGGVSLWRSTNVKSIVPGWARVRSPTPDNSPISAIVVSQGNSDIICIGHNNGDIYYTSNGTNVLPSWFKIDTPAPAQPDRFVTRLVIDSTRNPNWIYATYGGFSADNVYRSTDNGSTWADITGGPTIAGKTIGLPDVPVRTLVYHPTNPNLLYVGTEVGVFISDDAGASWEVPQNGPANVSVDELFWMGGDLIAVTHGRGLYRASGGIYVDCNYNGKNGTENGTFDRPFKTIAAALNASPTYRTIWLKPCTYFEPVIFNKRVELRSLGGPATVRRP